MKQVNSIFLMLIIGLLFSCNNDSNDSEISILEKNKLNIIGTWAITSSFIENGTGESELYECDLTERLKFKSNNMLDITEYVGPNCSELNEYSIGYLITETHLTFDTYPSEIIELTATTLKLKFFEDGMEVGTRYIDTYTKQ